MTAVSMKAHGEATHSTGWRWDLPWPSTSTIAHHHHATTTIAHHHPVRKRVQIQPKSNDTAPAAVAAVLPFEEPDRVKTKMMTMRRTCRIKPKSRDVDRGHRWIASTNQHRMNQKKGETEEEKKNHGCTVGHASKCRVKCVRNGEPDVKVAIPPRRCRPPTVSRSSFSWHRHAWTRA